MRDDTRYPFIPKSNRSLRPGQYWSIPLSDGRFAAGRVTVVPAFGPTDRVGVVIALMDWSGDHEPTDADIAGLAVLEGQAKSRFEAISKNGGRVLGLRPLDLDGIVPIDPMDLRVGSKHRVWGWRTIFNLAEAAFVLNTSSTPDDSP
jgi:hypothetical protein